MGLFRVRREVQFVVCHKDRASVEKREAGSVEDGLWLCALQVLLQGREVLFLLALPLSQGSRAPVLSPRSI